MLSKLAIKNIKRSFKDYIIYLITVIFAFSLMFAYNLVTTSKDVIELSDLMQNFESSMYLVNSFIIIAICFLINYTTKFMFTKRSKEFATYMILGLKKKQITRMFTFENLALGIISLIISLPIGYLFSILLSAIIMNFFKLPHLVKITLNIKAVLFLIIYFLIIYLIVLILSYKRLRKLKIKDLMYLDKQNEKPLQKKKLKNITFIISLVLGIISLILFGEEFKEGSEPSIQIIFISIFLIIISIYGISITLSDFFLNFIIKHKNIKYKKDNLFVVRNFYSKVKTMSFTIGTLSFLITITLISLNISSLFKNMFDYQLNQIASYDIAIEDTKETFPKYIDTISKNYTITDKLIYNGFINENKNITKVLNNNSWRDIEEVIKLSDYNKLLKMKNEKTISLKNNEYYIHTLKENKNKSINKLNNITLSNGVNLKLKDINFKGYSYAWGYGYGYVIVVPDNAVKNLAKGNNHLIVNTKEETKESFYKDLVKISSPDMCQETKEGYSICYSVSNIIVRGQQEANNKSFMTISSFICFYVALIFTAIVGTILAIELLKESTKYKYRYQVLKKIGVRENDLYHTIFKQLFIFYLFPIIYPIIVSFSSISSMNKLFKITLETDYQYLQIYIFNIIIFAIFYTIYFTATYFGFKKNIQE